MAMVNGRLIEANEALSEARWIAWRLKRIISEFPVGLEDIDMGLAEFIYNDSNAHEWLEGPEGNARFGGEGPNA